MESTTADTTCSLEKKNRIHDQQFFSSIKMKFKFFAVLAMVPLAIAQGVTDKIAPPGDTPAGCQPNGDGRFEITVVPLAEKAKRDSLLAVRHFPTEISNDTHDSEGRGAGPWSTR
jgi:hypothetical protein